MRKIGLNFVWLLITIVLLVYFIGKKLSVTKKDEFEKRPVEFTTKQYNFHDSVHNESKLSLEPVVNTIEWDSCKSQFNDEFNFPIHSDLPVPMSIFHRQSTIYLIFSTENYVSDWTFPDWKRNFTSPSITDVEKWFAKDIWQVQYQSNGHVKSVLCQPVEADASLILVVTCPLNQPEKL